MASLREIKDRIGSVRSTLKITSAMKLVASAKLRKAQKAIEALRPYERTLAEILNALPSAESSRRAARNIRCHRISDDQGAFPPDPLRRFAPDKVPEKPIPAPLSAAGRTVAALPDDEGSAAAGFVAPNPVPATAGSEDGRRGAGLPNRQAATAVVAIASNSSLCGGFNANVIRKALETIRECEGAVEVYPLGRKMVEALRRAGYTCPVDYNDLVGHPSYEKSAALARSLAERFERGELSRVVLVYNRFASASRQEPVAEPYLPFTSSSFAGLTGESPAGADDYILEPDAAALAAQLLPQVMMLKFHAAILDSAAAEQAARTIAMQTASDNAEDLLGELTLEYNKGRQQKITAEILDLLGGAQ